MFLKDPELEKQTHRQRTGAAVIQKLVTLAQDWLRDTGQAVPAVVASRVMQRRVPCRRVAPRPKQPKPGRYLRGVR